MLTLCSTEENKDFYQMLQSWQQDKQEDQMGWRWLKQKPDAEAILSTINLLSELCAIKKGWSFEVSLYIHPKIVKEYADGLSPKIYERG